MYSSLGVREGVANFAGVDVIWLLRKELPTSADLGGVSTCARREADR